MRPSLRTVRAFRELPSRLAGTARFGPPFSFYYWKRIDRAGGLPAEEVEDYVKKVMLSMTGLGTSYLEKEYENVLQGKRSEKKFS